MKKGLESQIRLLMGLFALGICLVVGGISLYMGQKAVREEAEKGLRIATELGAEKIQIIVENLLLVLQEIANQEGIRSMDFATNKDF